MNSDNSLPSIPCNCGYYNKYNEKPECEYCGEKYMEKPVDSSLEEFLRKSFGYKKVEFIDGSSVANYYRCAPTDHNKTYSKVAELYKLFGLVYLGTDGVEEFWCGKDEIITFAKRS